MRFTLQAEHDRIQALCERIIVLLHDAAEPGHISTGPVRGELAAMLVDHMKFKQAMVYRPLRQTAQPAKMATIDHMDELCERLYADYVAHRDSWTIDRILADWPDYRARTIELIERLERAIALERVHIYPLLATTDAKDRDLRASLAKR